MQQCKHYRYVLKSFCCCCFGFQTTALVNQYYLFPHFYLYLHISITCTFWSQTSDYVYSQYYSCWSSIIEMPAFYRCFQPLIIMGLGFFSWSCFPFSITVQCTYSAMFCQKLKINQFTCSKFLVWREREREFTKCGVCVCVFSTQIFMSGNNTVRPRSDFFNAVIYFSSMYKFGKSRKQPYGILCCDFSDFCHTHLLDLSNIFTADVDIGRHISLLKSKWV